MEKRPSPDTARKQYEPPKLVTYGSVSELTHQKNGGGGGGGRGGNRS